MLAIVETCGKQYQLQEGRYVDVEYLGVEQDSKVEFDKVVMILAGANSTVGQPYVEGAVVKGTVTLNGKNKKILVYKQRCKKGYRKKQGHRQMFSRVMVDSILFNGKENLPQEAAVEVKETAETAKKATAEKKTAKKAVKTEKVKAETKTTAKKTTKKPAAKKAEETKTEE
ncbi:MAG: 50S ribosomal protein L21 [Candidatus Gastranaerophilales bacterium]|nr:50S ribosomal protein L21 [Candidatus Gastranaerophilales bacterium]